MVSCDLFDGLAPPAPIVAFFGSSDAGLSTSRQRDRPPMALSGSGWSTDVKGNMVLERLKNDLSL